MLIIKKILILVQVEESGASGVVRMENFGGRTSCDINLVGAEPDWWLGVFVEDDLVVCTNKQGKVYADKQADLSKPIVCLVMSGDRVLAVGCINHATAKQGAMKSKIKEYQSWYKQECKLDSLQSVHHDENIQKVDTYPSNEKESQPINATKELEVSEQISANDEKEELQNDNAISHEELDEQVEFLPLHFGEQDGPTNTATNTPKNTTDDMTASEKTDSSVSQATKAKSSEISTAKSKNNAQNQSKNTAKANQKSSPKQADSNFFESIKGQMDKLMTDYERDKELEKLVANSKWVRVPTEDGYYVVGIISNDGEPELLCYGVPDEDNTNPPKCDKSCRQWLEVGENKGYWMMYQCAKTGKMLQDDQIVK